MRITNYKAISRAIIILSVVFVVALAAGTWVTRAQSTVPQPPAGFCHDASALSGDQAQGFLSAPSGNGQFACGVFDVCGWGTINVDLVQYPKCTTTNLTVLCMNDNGQWVNNTVENVGVSSDGKIVTFDVTQHKTCALFPAGSTPNDLKGPVISGN